MGLCCCSCCSSCLLSSIFRPEWISFSFLFCSFWHPTKLIASKGIGVEGLVLFWQFFQEWPSIRWSIVLERDLSLLNSWLAAKKADATKVLKVCKVHYNLMRRSHMKDEGQCFIMISLQVYMSRWGDRIARCLGLDRLCIILIFSVMIILHTSCSGGLIGTKESRIIWDFLLMKLFWWSTDIPMWNPVIAFY